MRGSGCPPFCFVSYTNGSTFRIDTKNRLTCLVFRRSISLSTSYSFLLLDFLLDVKHIHYEVVRNEGGVRVCRIAVLGYFWCGVAVIFNSKYGIAVFGVQAVCGKFKFYVAVVGEKIVVSR